MDVVIKLLCVAIGLFLSIISFPIVINAILGSCFFEQGCGEGESLKLLAAGFVCLFIGVASGLLLFHTIEMVKHKIIN